MTTPLSSFPLGDMPFKHERDISDGMGRLLPCLSSDMFNLDEPSLHNGIRIKLRNY